MVFFSHVGVTQTGFPSKTGLVSDLPFWGRKIKSRSLGSWSWASKIEIYRRKDGFLETEVTNSLKVISSQILGCIWACWTKIQSDHGAKRMALHHLRNLRWSKPTQNTQTNKTGCFSSLYDLGYVETNPYTINHCFTTIAALGCPSARMCKEQTHYDLMPSNSTRKSQPHPRESWIWWCYLPLPSPWPHQLQESWSCPTSSWS